MARIFCVIILFFLSVSITHATTIDFSHASNLKVGTDGLLRHVGPGGKTTIMQSTLQLSERFNVPFSKGEIPVDVTRTKPVSMTNRLGRAVGNFVKKVGPIAVGIAVADLVCDLSNICHDGNGGWLIPTPYGDPLVYPQTTDLGYWYYISQASGGGQTLTAACSAAVTHLGSGYSGHLEGEICKIYYNDNLSNNAQKAYIPDSCSTHYANVGGVCELQESTINKIPTDQDWTDAETALTDERFIQPLLDNGEPIPVDFGENFPPVNTIAGSTTKQITDGDGNVIGTEVTERSVTLSDASSESAPNTFNITETETVTNYDINNNITNQTVATSEPPPPIPPTEEITIEFDDVPDSNLDTHDVPDMDSWTSWGSGTCPAPLDVVTSIWSGQIDTQPMCDFAEMIKPLVLLFGALVSALIVSGIRSGG